MLMLSAHKLRLLGSAFLMRVFGWRFHDWVQTLYFCGWCGWVRGRKRVKKFHSDIGSSFPVKLAVCTIMKNEASYLKEWIEFHRIVGVERFYLYDNGCTDETDEVLQRYVKDGTVVLVRYPGEKMQLAAYEDCVERFHAEARWIAFIDVDEFIVPEGANEIAPILDSLPSECDQVSLEWLIFGSAGQEHKTKEPVIKRFVRRGKKHWLEKSIVNPSRVYKMDVHIHFVAGRTIRLPQDVLHINHYHCKSWEEYSKKASKGDVMHGISGGDKYCRQCFDRHDLNDVQDRCALRFLPELEKRLGMGDVLS